MASPTLSESANHAGSDMGSREGGDVDSRLDLRLDLLVQGSSPETLDAFINRNALSWTEPRVRRELKVYLNTDISQGDTSYVFINGDIQSDVVVESHQNLDDPEEEDIQQVEEDVVYCLSLTRVKGHVPNSSNGNLGDNPTGVETGHVRGFVVASGWLTTDYGDAITFVWKHDPSSACMLNSLHQAVVRELMPSDNAEMSGGKLSGDMWVAKSWAKAVATISGSGNCNEHSPQGVQAEDATIVLIDELVNKL